MLLATNVSKIKKTILYLRIKKNFVSEKPTMTGQQKIKTADVFLKLGN